MINLLLLKEIQIVILDVEKLALVFVLHYVEILVEVVVEINAQDAEQLRVVIFQFLVLLVQVLVRLALLEALVVVEIVMGVVLELALLARLVKMKMELVPVLVIVKMAVIQDVKMLVEVVQALVQAPVLQQEKILQALLIVHVIAVGAAKAIVLINALALVLMNVQEDVQHHLQLLNFF